MYILQSNTCVHNLLVIKKLYINIKYLLRSYLYIINLY